MAGAGDLDRRIRFERVSTVKDGMGGTAEDGWSPLGSVWANRADASDGERFAADEVSAVRMTRFKVRSSSLTRGVTPIDRIFFDKTHYEIQGIKETAEGRNNYLEFTTVVRNDWSRDL